MKKTTWDVALEIARESPCVAQYRVKNGSGNEQANNYHGYSLHDCEGLEVSFRDGSKMSFRSPIYAIRAIQKKSSSVGLLRIAVSVFFCLFFMALNLYLYIIFRSK